MRLSLLICCFIVMCCEGCGPESASVAVSIPEEVTARTLLLSEIQSAENPADVIDCPIEITNHIGQSQSIQLLKTGCSCYGVVVNGRAIERGEKLQIGGRHSLAMNINAQPPTTESNQTYRASFKVMNESQEESFHDLACKLQVYRDIKVFPNVLVCETEPGKSGIVIKSLTLERIYRSRSGKTSAPLFERLPEGVSIEGIQPEGEPIELEAGLWKANWSAQVQVEFNDDVTAIGSPRPFTIRFAEKDDSNQVSGLTTTSQIIRRLRVPIAYPKHIHFGRLAAGESRERAVFLSSVDGSEFELAIDSELSPPNVTVEIPSEMGSRHRVMVTISGRSPGDWEGILTLKTDLPEQPEIKINLIAVFVEPLSD